MATLEGIEFNESCQLQDYWKKACDLWVKTMTKICENFDFSDSPWEYLERTNSAILAGSLTHAGAPAMPETYVERQSNAAHIQERVDICIVTRSQDRTVLELVECKKAEYHARHGTTEKAVKRCLKAASRQVQNIIGLHSRPLDGLPVRTEINHTAAVIGLPKFAKGDESLMSLSINQIIESLKVLIEDGSLDVVAWDFPEECLKISKRYNEFYPGTFLAVAKVPLRY